MEKLSYFQTTYGIDENQHTRSERYNLLGKQQQSVTLPIKQAVSDSQ